MFQNTACVLARSPGVPSTSTGIQVPPGPRPQLDPRPHKPPIRQWTVPSGPGPTLKLPEIKEPWHKGRV